ncbi:hypothetical protein FA95DRAFT_1677114 [Auriscalpium vulgare]|uniref:Uncharacterized protein n=1 Tax=Auriscalpium vulgare TaxID=40419 RepID=A0ACB8S1Q6_9AGAM|nr:hypothetical protein FA95DRAFT_1677114 [Auriscalpium vulgare]
MRATLQKQAQAQTAMAPLTRRTSGMLKKSQKVGFMVVLNCLSMRATLQKQAQAQTAMAPLTRRTSGMLKKSQKVGFMVVLNEIIGLYTLWKRYKEDACIKLSRWIGSFPHALHHLHRRPRPPRRLPCSHVYCHDCLARLVAAATPRSVAACAACCAPVLTAAFNPYLIPYILPPFRRLYLDAPFSPPSPRTQSLTPTPAPAVPAAEGEDDEGGARRLRKENATHAELAALMHLARERTFAMHHECDDDVVVVESDVESAVQDGWTVSMFSDP